MKKIPFLQRINWKIPLVRILINSIALVITVLVMPRIRFLDPSLLSILLLAIALGVLNALVKPLLQFLLLPLIFASYGLVVVLVNTLLLYLLEFLFPDFFAVDSLLWAFVAGAFIGLLGTFLENLLGLVPPIVPDEETGLRKKFIEGRFASLGGASVTRQLAQEERLAIATPENERLAIEPGLEIQTPRTVAEAETSTPTVSPVGDGPSEADASPAPPEGTPDAANSLSEEQSETTKKEEDEV